MNDMKNVNEICKVGEIIVLKFIPNKEPGKRNIAWHNNIICFIDYQCKFVIADDSVWHCLVTKINERSIVVNPLTKSHSLAVNATVYKKPERIKKPKSNYQYNRKG